MGTNELDQFTEDEFRKAYLFILPEAEASAKAKKMIAADPVDSHDSQNTAWEISGDLLDLLSLVSEECAAKVAQILGLNPEAAKGRRQAFVDFHGIPWP